MTISNKYRNDAALHGAVTTSEPARPVGRRPLREPHGLISHWYPYEELTQQTDLYA